MTFKVKAIFATLSILVFLGILVFASASEATIGRRFTTVTPADPDLIFCKSQRSSSADLWTCYDYYDNEFTNLKIIQVK